MHMNSSLYIKLALLQNILSRLAHDKFLRAVDFCKKLQTSRRTVNSMHSMKTTGDAVRYGAGVIDACLQLAVAQLASKSTEQGAFARAWGP